MQSPEQAPAADQPFALVGTFDTPAALVHACEALRDQGYEKFDAHTPFPVHGLDRAMGMKASKVAWITLGAGLMGGLGGFALQMWTQGVDYPQNISGKPFFAFQAYVPVTFEATILCAALGTFLGMWALNRLPELFHPVHQAKHFPKVSDDKFLVSIEASDQKFERRKTAELLAGLGAKDVEEVAP